MQKTGRIVVIVATALTGVLVWGALPVAADQTQLQVSVQSMDCTHTTIATGGAQNTAGCSSFAPTIEQVTNNTSGQPLIKGAIDTVHLGSFKVTVNNITYVLGTNPQLTIQPGTELWTLDLTTLSPALSPGNYTISAQFTDNLLVTYTSTNTVNVPQPPQDMCVNIPGLQTTVPAGMVVSPSGQCTTPVPNPPVDTTDVCSNLDGIQTAIPVGYYRTSSNECYLQPIPPAVPFDVCANIPDMQLIVPLGYTSDQQGNCIAPVDFCPNITGLQTRLPEGMAYNTTGDCYTPSNTTTLPPTQTTDNGPNGDLYTTPPALKPVLAPLVSLVPQQMKTWLRSLPPVVAETVPYYVFTMVSIVAAIPILQSIQEAVFAAKLLGLLKTRRAIAEQKDNFIALASHYLRTPLTLMKNGVDMVTSMNEVPAETAKPLEHAVADLSTHIGLVLKDVENNSALKDIPSPEIGQKAPPVWRSVWFWGPIISSIVLTAIANFLLSVVGNKQVGFTNSFFQFLVAAVAFFVLYLGVRNLYVKRLLRKQQNSLVAHEQVIDDARNRFILSATSNLQNGLSEIEAAKDTISDAPSSSFFQEGYERMNAMLQKFLLLGQVQAGASQKLEVFDLHEAIDNLLVTYNSAISEKRLTVANMTSTLFIKQNRMLFNFVLSSLLDNAIKFNQDGGTIEISAEPGTKMLSLKVIDNGIGIEQEKLGQLFKPFSRASSATEFNYEGLGFSLFLDKIIMDFTGGEISAESAVNEGSSFYVQTPLAISE